MKSKWKEIEGPGSMPGLESPDGKTRIFEDGSVELIDHCEWPSCQLVTAKLKQLKTLMNTDSIPDSLAVEIAFELAGGAEQVTVAELDRRLANLGYKRYKITIASGTARNLSTGNTYPSTTYGLKEIDTGMSAFHFTARRDEKFKALQKLRSKIFAVRAGRMITI